MDEPSFIEGAMFGCVACYLRGLLVLVLADTEEPWNGLLVPTDRKHHETLIAQFPGFSSHPVLGKWLYLDGSDEDFEPRAQRLVRAIAAGHPLIGIEPGVTSARGRKKKRKTAVRARKSTKQKSKKQ